MSTKEMENKVTELKELKAMQEELQAEITALEDVIKAEIYLVISTVTASPNNPLQAHFDTVCLSDSDFRAVQAVGQSLSTVCLQPICKAVRLFLPFAAGRLK